MLVVGCKPAETPREQARSVVLTIADGVRQIDLTCAAIAKDRGDLALAYECASLISEARSQLLTAEDIVDAWDAAVAGKLACSMRSAASVLERLMATLARAGTKPPAAAEDAIRLAPLVTSGCAS